MPRLYTGEKLTDQLISLYSMAGYLHPYKMNIIFFNSHSEHFSNRSPDCI